MSTGGRQHEHVRGCCIGQQVGSACTALITPCVPCNCLLFSCCSNFDVAAAKQKLGTMMAWRQAHRWVSGDAVSRCAVARPRSHHTVPRTCMSSAFMRAPDPACCCCCCRCRLWNVPAEDVAAELATGKALAHAHPDVFGRPVLVVRAHKHTPGAHRWLQQVPQSCAGMHACL